MRFVVSWQSFKFVGDVTEKFVDKVTDMFYSNEVRTFVLLDVLCFAAWHV